MKKRDSLAAERLMMIRMLFLFLRFIYSKGRLNFHSVRQVQPFCKLLADMDA